MKDPLSLANRKRIYEFIVGRPGTHVREIERELDLQTGVLTFHLEKLEKGELVRSEDDGYRLRYYPAKNYILKNRKTLALLRQEQPKKIVQLVLTLGNLSFQQLNAELGVSKSTLSHHLKKLTGEKLLVAEKVEREVYYRAIDPDQLVNIIILMDRGSENDVEERFADIWKSLRP